MAIIEGAITGNQAEVDVNRNLAVNLPRTQAQSGYAVLLGESHDGATGAARLTRPLRVSTDGRLRTGIDAQYWQDTFNHAQLNLSAYSVVLGGAVGTAMAGGFLVFNSANSLVNGGFARLQTYKTVPLNGGGALEVSFRLRFAVALAANTVIEFGLGFAAGVATPTDGAYFKVNTAGQLVGVYNVNGTETTTGAFPNPVPNAVDYYRMVVDQDRVEFYVNSVLQGVLTISPSVAAVSFSRSLPLLVRQYINATLTTAQRLEVSDVVVLARDLAQNRPWATASSGMGNGAYNQPTGATAGQTANYVNSTAPVSATLSNTAAGYTTLGGQYQFAAVAGAETDYALFAFQVPVALAAGGNKNLVVRGVRIEAVNLGAAVATTATLLQWGLGVGSTAANLTTGDSFSTYSRAPRRLALGFQNFAIGAAIGAQAQALDVNLDAPVYVEAGTFLHVILKMPLGTATASQIIRGTVTVNGYFE